MVKKKYTTREVEKKMNTNVFIILIIVSFIILIFAIVIVDRPLKYKIEALETEIATMPHYECWNESYSGIVNKKEIDYHCEVDGGGKFCTGTLLQFIGENLYEPNYYNINIDCEINEVCYYSYEKEVCKLNNYAKLGDGE